MGQNGLKLDETNTEVIVLGSKKASFKTELFEPLPLFFSQVIEPSVKIKNLGFVVDEYLTLKPQINATVRSSFFQLKLLRKPLSILDGRIWRWWSGP